jgi:anti-sigma-K factor RskA
MTDPERNLLAGEYVLGTLDQQESAKIEAAMATDPGLRDAVETWERQLAPLEIFMTPEAAPPGLWRQIEADLWPQRRPSLWRFVWPAWAVGATVVAASLAFFAVLPRTPAIQMTAVLVADANQPAYLARVDASGGLQLAAAVSAGGVRPQAPAGRSLQLWGLPPGATAPRSLGVLPRGAGSFTVTAGALRAVPNMLILISQEPEGGSPTGQATGPVVFYGRLTAVGG